MAKNTLSKSYENDIAFLKAKYGKEFEKLNGLSEEQLDHSAFIDSFVDNQVIADATIDVSANVDIKDIASLLAEMNKPNTKELSFNKIHYEIIKKYGRETAREWIETEWNGGFYLHNAHTSSLMSYCYASSLEDIANNGLFFLGRYKSNHAEHLDTFNNHVLEFLSYSTNRISGAM